MGMSFALQACIPHNSTMMKCPTPSLHELLDYTMLSKLPKRKRSVHILPQSDSHNLLTRNKRQLDTSEYNSLTDDANVSVYINQFDLDGVHVYENFRAALPEYAYITVTRVPDLHGDKYCEIMVRH